MTAKKPAKKKPTKKPAKKTAKVVELDPVKHPRRPTARRPIKPESE